MTCDVVTFFGPCPFPAASQVVMACVHEHFRDGPMCAAHVDESRRPDDSGGDCRACRECARPHPCLLTLIRVEPLAVTG